MENYVTITAPIIDVEYVKNLLKTTPNFGISNIFIYEKDKLKRKTTLLHHAVEKNDEKLLDYLIDANVNLDVVIPMYETALHVAVSNRNLKFVKKLVESGANINARVSTLLGMPLTRAVFHKNFEISKCLIDNGADVHAATPVYANIRCHTPVLIAASFGYDDIVKLLLKNNAEPFGRIELKNLNITGVKEILSTTPNININSFFIWNDFISYKECGAYTLTHLAVKYKNEELLDYLIESNANINVCIPGIGTALNIAAKNDDLHLIKKLISSGADVNARTADWSVSPLIQAAVMYNLEAAQCLIENGADVNSTAIDYSYLDSLAALHIAVQNNYRDLVELLLKNNADVNIKSKKGWTPLMFAYEIKNLFTIEMLVDYGAIYNGSVLYVAVRGQTWWILEYLLTLDIGAIDVYFNGAQLVNPFLYSHLEKLKKKGFQYYEFDYIDIMFDAGFNINSLNHNDELIADIANDNRKLLNLVKRHIIKLKQAGFYVCQRNIGAVKDGYDDFHIDCYHEISKLKEDKIGTSNSAFFEIFHKSFYSLTILLRHSNIDNIVNKNKLVKIYPIYGRMIYYKLAKVQRRIELLNNVEEFLDYVLNYCLKLPYTFTRELHLYLTNENLKKLLN